MYVFFRLKSERSLFLSNVLKTLFQEVAVLLCVLFVASNSPSLGVLSHGPRAQRRVQVASNGVQAPIHRAQSTVLFVSARIQSFFYFFFSARYRQRNRLASQELHSID